MKYIQPSKSKIRNKNIKVVREKALQKLQNAKLNNDEHKRKSISKYRAKFNIAKAKTDRQINNIQNVQVIDETEDFKFSDQSTKFWLNLNEVESNPTENPGTQKSKKSTERASKRNIEKVKEVLAQYDDRRYKFVNLDHSDTSSNLSTSKISNLSSIDTTLTNIKKWVSPRDYKGVEKSKISSMI